MNMGNLFFHRIKLTENGLTPPPHSFTIENYINLLCGKPQEILQIFQISPRAGRKMFLSAQLYALCLALSATFKLEME